MTMRWEIQLLLDEVDDVMQWIAQLEDEALFIKGLSENKYIVQLQDVYQKCRAVYYELEQIKGN